MNIAKLASRRKAARTENRHLRTAQDELYRYVLPYRKPSTNSKTGSKSDQIFDSTAPKAAFRFAGRMEQEVTPPFQDFFELKTGPFLQTNSEDEKKSINEALELVSKQIGAVLQGTNFTLSMSEMYLDLFGGTGALLMMKDETDVVDFTAVPISEIDLRENGKGKVTGVFWEKKFKHEDLDTLWPSVRLPEEVKKTVEKNPEKPISVVQATEFNKKTKQWDFTAYLPKHLEHGEIYKSSERTNPWLTPRFYKVPGEAMGRGPGLMGLPAIKTLNKVTELTIKAAAIAIMGIWTYRNDRKFNPKTARMVPGAMWPVGSNGNGPLGPSLQRLDAPGRFDISNLVMQELRMSVKEATLDDTLPADASAVRSATEIVERMKRLSRDLAGAYGRLVLEIIRPLIQRIIDCLEERDLIPENITIDQLLFQVQVNSPIARGQQAAQVSALVEWMEIMLAMGGKEMMMLTARVENVFADIGVKLGVSEKYIRSKLEKEQIGQVVAQIIANAQMAAQQASGAPPPPDEPGNETQQGARADLLA